MAFYINILDSIITETQLSVDITLNCIQTVSYDMHSMSFPDEPYVPAVNDTILLLQNHYIFTLTLITLPTSLVPLMLNNP